VDAHAVRSELHPRQCQVDQCQDVARRLQTGEGHGITVLDRNVVKQRKLRTAITPALL